MKVKQLRAGELIQKIKNLKTQISKIFSIRHTHLLKINLKRKQIIYGQEKIINKKVKKSKEIKRPYTKTKTFSSKTVF
jgi:hypothetical protein